jgi:hypothetical protein
VNAPAFKRKSPFAQKRDEHAKVPACLVTLEPAHFRDGRPGKPAAAVQVGLRLLAEKTFEDASARAAKDAWVTHPEPIPDDLRVEHYNNRLMGYLMAEAAVLAGNVEVKFFSDNLADVKIFLDLTPDGIRFLWDHYEAFAISTSPTAPEATDEELDVLADGLASGELLGSLDIEKGRKVRRLLRAVLREAGVSG